jgi:hypothetical protein
MSGDAMVLLRFEPAVRKSVAKQKWRRKKVGLV